MNAKKMIIGLMFLLTLTSFVFAQGNGGRNFVFDGEGNSITTYESYNRLKGLELAKVIVENPEAQNRIESALERLREINYSSLNNCGENCLIEAKYGERLSETYQLRIQKRSRFAFFEVNAVESIEIDDKGNIIERKTNFWQNLKDIGLVKNIDQEVQE